MNRDGEAQSGAKEDSQGAAESDEESESKSGFLICRRERRRTKENEDQRLSRQAECIQKCQMNLFEFFPFRCIITCMYTYYALVLLSHVSPSFSNHSGLPSVASHAMPRQTQ